MGKDQGNSKMASGTARADGSASGRGCLQPNEVDERDIEKVEGGMVAYLGTAQLSGKKREIFRVWSISDWIMQGGARQGVWGIIEVED